TSTASVTLAAGDAVVCAYSLDPPAVPAGLTVRLYSPGAGAAFGVTLAAGSGSPQALTVTTASDGVAVTAGGADLSTLAPGSYTATVTPPAAEAAGWSLTAALCNGTAASISGMTATFTL